MQEAVDTTVNHRVKVCRVLADFLVASPVVDSFRFCHPQDREYTFRRPGVALSHLDRDYVPGAYLHLMGAVWHEATILDHSALCLSFKGSLSASPPAPPPPPPKSY
jgi:hypothetical protein